MSGYNNRNTGRGWGFFSWRCLLSGGSTFSFVLSPSDKKAKTKQNCPVVCPHTVTHHQSATEARKGPERSGKVRSIQTIFPRKQWRDFIDSQRCRARCHRLDMKRNDFFDRILQRKEVDFYTSAHLSSSSSCLGRGGGGGSGSGSDPYQLPAFPARPLVHTAVDAAAACLPPDSSITA